MNWKFDKALIQRMIDRMDSGPHKGAMMACITEIDSLEMKVEEMQKVIDTAVMFLQGNELFIKAEQIKLMSQALKGES